MSWMTEEDRNGQEENCPLYLGVAELNDQCGLKKATMETWAPQSLEIVSWNLWPGMGSSSGHDPEPKHTKRPKEIGFVGETFGEWKPPPGLAFPAHRPSAQRVFALVMAWGCPLALDLLPVLEVGLSRSVSMWLLFPRSQAILGLATQSCHPEMSLRRMLVEKWSFTLVLCVVATTTPSSQGF